MTNEEAERLNRTGHPGNARHPANDTDRQSLLTAERRRQIEELARQFPSATLRAAADRAFERELEQSVESAQPAKFPF